MVKYLWNGIVSTIVTFVTLWHDVTGSGSYQGLFNSTITWSYYFGHMIKIILFDNLIFYFIFRKLQSVLHISPRKLWKRIVLRDLSSWEVLDNTVSLGALSRA